MLVVLSNFLCAILVMGMDSVQSMWFFFKQGKRESCLNRIDYSS